MSHQILDNLSHADLKVITRRGADYGDNIHCTPAYLAEFRQLQTHYPIFFRKNNEQQFEPVVLLGFTEQQNLFLTAQGWQASYIPLSIQRQPFLIAFQHSTENGVPVQQPVVCIDTSHPRVSRTEGEPLFLPQGGNSPYLQHISSVLATIQQGHQQNLHFTTTLATLDMIEPLTLELSLPTQQTHRITGLYTINEARLNQLNSGQLASLHQQGYLQHCYMMIASAMNVRSMLQLPTQG